MQALKKGKVFALVAGGLLFLVFSLSGLRGSVVGDTLLSLGLYAAAVSFWIALFFYRKHLAGRTDSEKDAGTVFQKERSGKKLLCDFLCFVLGLVIILSPVMEVISWFAK